MGLVEFAIADREESVMAQVLLQNGAVEPLGDETFL
jgi:hypothetical protein